MGGFRPPYQYPPQDRSFSVDMRVLWKSPDRAYYHEGPGLHPFVCKKEIEEQCWRFSEQYTWVIETRFEGRVITEIVRGVPFHSRIKCHCHGSCDSPTVYHHSQFVCDVCGKRCKESGLALLDVIADPRVEVFDDSLNCLKNVWI